MKLILYDRLGTVPLFDEDLERDTGGGPGPVRLLRDEVAAADALLIATPEYNWSFPGVLKNALDWLSRPAPTEVLTGKPVAVIGASAGQWGTRLAQNHLRQVLAATECLVMPSPTLFIRRADRLFDVTGKLADASAQEALAGVLRRFATWIDATAPDWAPAPTGEAAVEQPVR